LQKRVCTGLDSRHQMSRIKGDLLNLCEVVLRVLIEEELYNLT